LQGWLWPLVMPQMNERISRCRSWRCHEDTKMVSTPRGRLAVPVRCSWLSAVNGPAVLASNDGSAPFSVLGEQHRPCRVGNNRRVGKVSHYRIRGISTSNTSSEARPTSSRATFSDFGRPDCATISVIGIGAVVVPTLRTAYFNLASSAASVDPAVTWNRIGLASTVDITEPPLFLIKAWMACQTWRCFSDTGTIVFPLG